MAMPASINYHGLTREYVGSDEVEAVPKINKKRDLFQGFVAAAAQPAPATFSTPATTFPQAITDQSPESGERPTATATKTNRKERKGKKDRKERDSS